MHVKVSVAEDDKNPTQEVSIYFSVHTQFQVPAIFFCCPQVYQSERQSGTLQQSGLTVPCAPPATPAPEMYEQYEYIPSMGDIRVSSA